MVGEGSGPEDLPEIAEWVLSLRNGVDRPEVWIAYQGVVYDAGRSHLWRRGRHYEHWAGQDLTDELADAPHGEEVFERLPVVGRLKT